LVPIAVPPYPGVNVTAPDLAEFPILQQMLSDWDAQYGNATGAISLVHPYRDAVRIVHALQAKFPGRYWNGDSIIINHNGRALEFSADRRHY
jgi:hypothetical protein